MCESLDEPEPIDSALMLPSGYDTMEYSWVKATAVSVRLRILFMTLQSTNNDHVGNFYRDFSFQKNSERFPTRATVLSPVWPISNPATT